MAVSFPLPAVAGLTPSDSSGARKSSPPAMNGNAAAGLVSRWLPLDRPQAG